MAIFRFAVYQMVMVDRDSVFSLQTIKDPVPACRVIFRCKSQAPTASPRLLEQARKESQHVCRL